MTRSSQSAQKHYPVMNRKLAWLLVFLAFTAMGLLNFGYRYLDDLARGRTDTFGRRMLEEATGAYTALLLFPIMLGLVRRFRIRQSNWWRTLPMNLLIMAGFSVSHTTLMAFTRQLLAPVFGFGAYDYGIMLYRYPMEFSNDVIGFWSALAIIYIVDSYRESRDRQIATAELETRLAQAQLQNLRLQLQPHFLFNALNTISSVMHEDVNRADAMLAQLSDLLRQTLRGPDSQEVPLAEEIALLKNYLAIMQARFGNELQVDFSVEPSLSSALVPQLLLQPLVENSIRHGRDAHISRLDIQVRAQRQNGDLLLQVSDNGPGIPELNEAAWRKGIGLSNTEERLAALYGGNHAFLLENSDLRGLTVTVRLPFHTEAAF
jgi:sensor histidine kinase YesM